MPEEHGRVDTSSPGPDAEIASSRPAPPAVVLTTSMAPHADALLQAVRDAARGRYDVLGAAPQTLAGSPVYRAREVSSGRVVALRLSRDAAGTGYALALTEAAVPLADALPVDTPFAVPDVAVTDDAGPDAAGTDDARPMRCSQCRGAYELGVKFCPRDGSALRMTASANGIVGQVLGGKYLVERLLGRGGMGEVYLARHVGLDKPYAVKVMNRRLTDDPDALGRFHFEAKSASRLGHPNVASVYDVGDTPDGLVFFVMDYVPGDSLGALVGRDGPLAPARAAVVVAQIAEGLGAAHDIGLVHRDLKPDNVLVARRRDGTDLAKIVDFGIAKAVDGDGPPRTRTGYIIGTPEFMSPEQAAGEWLDARSDIYALGLVAFYALTGKIAFGGDTARDVMVRRLSEPPMTLVQAKPDVAWPTAVQSVMDRVLARDPEQRYQSAGAFGSDLATAVADWQRSLVPSGRTPRGLRLVVDLPVRWAREFSNTFRERRRASRPRQTVVYAAAAGGVLVGALFAVRAWPRREVVVVAPPPGMASTGRGDGRPDLPVAHPRWALAVTLVADGGSGFVRDGAGLDCDGAAGACSAQYDSGATVTLTATPGAHSAFAGWGGACAPSGRRADCRVLLDEARALTARFIPSGADPCLATASDLARLRGLTDPQRASEGDARTALREGPHMLPRLCTLGDSVEVRYHEAEAYLRLDDVAGACRALRAVRPVADATDSGRAIDVLFGTVCSAEP